MPIFPRCIVGLVPTSISCACRVRVVWRRWVVDVGVGVGLGVVEVLRRSLDVDLAVAGVAGVREVLADLARVEAVVDARRVVARRRLDDLARGGVAVCADVEVARAGNTTARNAAQVGERDRTLGALPGLEDALRDGAVSGAHVDVLARGLARLEPDDRRTLLDGDGARLTRLAARQGPDEFAKTVKAAVADVLSDGGIASFERQRRATGCRTWTDPVSGMVQLRGQFDPESGLILQGRLRHTVEQLFHRTVPDSCPTDPALKQDHLCALALLALVTSEPGSAAAPSGNPDLIVVVDEHTLRSGISSTSTVDPGSPDVLLPVETLRRIACVATIIPVVLNSDGVTVDIGRGARLATRAQRRAMRAMYPTCGIDGCRVPFEQCVLHHIHYWDNGGTDLSDLLPLCSRHHHAAHEGGWHLHLHPTTRHLTITYPDGTIQTTGPPRATAG